MKFSDKDLQYMLNKEYSLDEEPKEDLLINQPDGTQACLNWELAGRGFHILDTPRKYL
jgi:hypothetical protein